MVMHTMQCYMLAAVVVTGECMRGVVQIKFRCLVVLVVDVHALCALCTSAMKTTCIQPYMHALTLAW